MKTLSARSLVRSLAPLLLSALFVPTALAQRRSMDDILPPEERICGMLAKRQETDRVSYLLSTETQLVFLVNGPTVVRESFARITGKFPAGIGICVPADPLAQPDPTSALWVQWFAYIDPGASGVSVVNQRNSTSND